MMRRLGRILAAALLLAAGTAGAQSAPTFFRWLDAKGNMHVTDRLADVPEPYHSMYVARLKELEAQRSAAGKRPPAAAPAVQATADSAKAAAASPPPAPVAKLSIVEQEIQRREKWKATVKRWRTELEVATRQYETAKARLDQARLNPILRTTPKVQAEIKRYTARVEQALVRVEKARKTLLEDLPAQAKKENVPPKWLE